MGIYWFGQFKKIFFDSASSDLNNKSIRQIAAYIVFTVLPKKGVEDGSLKIELNDDEKKSLYVGSLEINKDKLRGFFRKAGSIFRSKSKTEDDKTDSRPVSNSRSLK